MSRTEVTAADILELLGESARLLHGEAGATITAPARLDQAGPGELTFFQPKRGRDPAKAISGTKAGLLIGPEDLDTTAAPDHLTVIGADNPRLRFVQVLNAFFSEPRPEPGVHPTAIIDPGAKIDPSAFIGPYVVVDGDVEIGPDSVIHAGVHIYPRTRIGARVVVHSGASIGQDGFGYDRMPDGTLLKFPHLGGVILEDDVEIGSSTCVDRGALQDTIVRKGARVDNMVQVGHNSDVGEETLLCSQSHMGGSSSIGRECWLGPYSSVRNGSHVGDRVFVGMMTYVTKNFGSDMTLAGIPARELGAFKAEFAAMRRLLRDHDDAGPEKEGDG
ncbi:MAG: UDP-3-O-(3-hydroxymyristoyl)glucosamine N-acyltransferase [Oceanicaulis sp.]